jgi:hypothetical protein
MGNSSSIRRPNCLSADLVEKKKSGFVAISVHKVAFASNGLSIVKFLAAHFQKKLVARELEVMLPGLFL